MDETMNTKKFEKNGNNNVNLLHGIQLFYTSLADFKDDELSNFTDEQLICATDDLPIDTAEQLSDVTIETRNVIDKRVSDVPKQVSKDGKLNTKVKKSTDEINNIDELQDKRSKKIFRTPQNGLQLPKDCCNPPLLDIQSKKTKRSLEQTLIKARDENDLLKNDKPGKRKKYKIKCKNCTCENCPLKEYHRKKREGRLEDVVGAVTCKCTPKCACMDCEYIKRLRALLCNTICGGTSKVETVTQQLETVSPISETGSPKPEKVTTTPETSSQKPESEKSEPETTTPTPETCTQEPENGTAETEILTPMPEKILPTPETGTQQPETVIPEPEPVFTKPETSTSPIKEPDPKTETKSPDTSGQPESDLEKQSVSGKCKCRCGELHQCGVTLQFDVKTKTESARFNTQSTTKNRKGDIQDNLKFSKERSIVENVQSSLKKQSNTECVQDDVQPSLNKRPNSESIQNNEQTVKDRLDRTYDVQYVAVVLSSSQSTIEEHCTMCCEENTKPKEKRDESYPKDAEAAEIGNDPEGSKKTNRTACKNCPLKENGKKKEDQFDTSSVIKCDCSPECSCQNCAYIKSVRALLKKCDAICKLKQKNDSSSFNNVQRLLEKECLNPTDDVIEVEIKPEVIDKESKYTGEKIKNPNSEVEAKPRVTDTEPVCKPEKRIDPCVKTNEERPDPTEKIIPENLICKCGARCPCENCKELKRLRLLFKKNIEPQIYCVINTVMSDIPPKKCECMGKCKKGSKWKEVVSKIKQIKGQNAPFSTVVQCVCAQSCSCKNCQCNTKLQDNVNAEALSPPCVPTEATPSCRVTIDVKSSSNVQVNKSRCNVCKKIIPSFVLCQKTKSPCDKLNETSCKKSKTNKSSYNCCKKKKTPCCTTQEDNTIAPCQRPQEEMILTCDISQNISFQEGITPEEESITRGEEIEPLQEENICGIHQEESFLQETELPCPFLQNDITKCTHQEKENFQEETKETPTCSQFFNKLLSNSSMSCSCMNENCDCKQIKNSLPKSQSKSSWYKYKRRGKRSSTKCNCVGTCKCVVCKSKSSNLTKCDCVETCKCTDCKFNPSNRAQCNCVGMCKCIDCKFKPVTSELLKIETFNEVSNNESDNLTSPSDSQILKLETAFDVSKVPQRKSRRCKCIESCKCEDKCTLCSICDVEPSCSTLEIPCENEKTPEKRPKFQEENQTPELEVEEPLKGNDCNIPKYTCICGECLKDSCPSKRPTETLKSKEIDCKCIGVCKCSPCTRLCGKNVEPEKRRCKCIDVCKCKCCIYTLEKETESSEPKLEVEVPVDSNQCNIPKCSCICGECLKDSCPSKNTDKPEYEVEPQRPESKPTEAEVTEESHKVNEPGIDKEQDTKCNTSKCSCICGECLKSSCPSKKTFKCEPGVEPQRPEIKPTEPEVTEESHRENELGKDMEKETKCNISKCSCICGECLKDSCPSKKTFKPEPEVEPQRPEIKPTEAEITEESDKENEPGKDEEQESGIENEIENAKEKEEEPCKVKKQKPEESEEQVKSEVKCKCTNFECLKEPCPRNISFEPMLKVKEAGGLNLCNIKECKCICGECLKECCSTNNIPNFEESVKPEVKCKCVFSECLKESCPTKKTSESDEDESARDKKQESIKEKEEKPVQQNEEYPTKEKQKGSIKEKEKKPDQDTGKTSKPEEPVKPAVKCMCTNFECLEESCPTKKSFESNIKRRHIKEKDEDPGKEKESEREKEPVKDKCNEPVEEKVEEPDQEKKSANKEVKDPEKLEIKCKCTSFECLPEDFKLKYPISQEEKPAKETEEETGKQKEEAPCKEKQKESIIENEEEPDTDTGEIPKAEEKIKPEVKCMCTKFECLEESCPTKKSFESDKESKTPKEKNQCSEKYEEHAIPEVKDLENVCKCATKNKPAKENEEELIKEKDEEPDKEKESERVKKPEKYKCIEPIEEKVEAPDNTEVKEPAVSEAKDPENVCKCATKNKLAKENEKEPIKEIYENPDMEKAKEKSKSKKEKDLVRDKCEESVEEKKPANKEVKDPEKLKVKCKCTSFECLPEDFKLKFPISQEKEPAKETEEETGKQKEEPPCKEKQDETIKEKEEEPDTDAGKIPKPEEPVKSEVKCMCTHFECLEESCPTKKSFDSVKESKPPKEKDQCSEKYEEYDIPEVKDLENVCKCAAKNNSAKENEEEPIKDEEPEKEKESVKDKCIEPVEEKVKAPDNAEVKEPTIPELKNPGNVCKCATKNKPVKENEKEPGKYEDPDKDKEFENEKKPTNQEVKDPEKLEVKCKCSNLECLPEDFKRKYPIKNENEINKSENKKPLVNACICKSKKQPGSKKQRKICKCSDFECLPEDFKAKHPINKAKIPVKSDNKKHLVCVCTENKPEPEKNKAKKCKCQQFECLPEEVKENIRQKYKVPNKKKPDEKILENTKICKCSDFKCLPEIKSEKSILECKCSDGECSSENCSSKKQPLPKEASEKKPEITEITPSEKSPECIVQAEIKVETPKEPDVKTEHQGCCCQPDCCCHSNDNVTQAKQLEAIEWSGPCSGPKCKCESCMGTESSDSKND